MRNGSWSYFGPDATLLDRDREHRNGDLSVFNWYFVGGGSRAVHIDTVRTRDGDHSAGPIPEMPSRFPPWLDIEPGDREGLYGLTVTVALAAMVPSAFVAVKI